MAGTAAVLWGFASSICPKQHLEFLCSRHLALSPCISSAFKWCIHTEVLTWLQLKRNPVLFCQKDQIFIGLMTIAVHAFARRTLTLLSADEI